MTVSQELADFIVNIKYNDLPQEVEEMAKKCVLDTIGVALGATGNETDNIWTEFINSVNAAPEASLWKPGYPKVQHWLAACANAAYGHILDFDDLHNTSIVHPGVVTVPAALALGQHKQSNGRDVLASIVAGYEVGARIGEAINPSSYWFWHTTGVVGNFSAAAVAGKLLNLDAQEMNHCFGSAGSQAAGLWEFMSDGAMTKTLHTGKACMNGIIAAQLASKGFTGATKILEGDKGFVKALASEYSLEAITQNLGNPYKIMGNSFKPYPCCRHCHSGIYAVQKIMEENAIDAEEVEQITDRTYGTALEITDNPEPRTIYAHKFSLQYCLAACLVYGNVKVDVFSEEKRSNQLVQELMKKVKLVKDPDIDAEFTSNPEKWIHQVKIVTKSGEVYNQRVIYPLGDAKNSMDWDQLSDKFRSLAAGHLAQEETEALLEKIGHMEKLEDINELFLSGSGRHR